MLWNQEGISLPFGMEFLQWKGACLYTHKLQVVSKDWSQYDKWVIYSWRRIMYWNYGEIGSLRSLIGPSKFTKTVQKEWWSKEHLWYIQCKLWCRISACSFSQVVFTESIYCWESYFLIGTRRIGQLKKLISESAVGMDVWAGHLN